MRPSRKRSGPDSALPKEARNGPGDPHLPRPTPLTPWHIPAAAIFELRLPGVPRDEDRFVDWCDQMPRWEQRGYIYLHLYHVLARLDFEGNLACWQGLVRREPNFIAGLCAVDPITAKHFGPYLKLVRPAAERRGPGRGRRLRGY